MQLTQQPIPELIRKIAIPASVGMVFHTLYNLVDTFYAGTISTAALSALSYTFALFLIVISLGIGLGQGTNALIAHALGEKAPQKAQLYTTQAIIFGVLVSIFGSVVGYLSAPALLELMGAVGEDLQLALDYINVIFIGAVFMILSGIINAGLLAQGDSKSNSRALIAGFFVNLVLDPLFLNGFGPIPGMGVAGIALATIVIQAGVCVYLWYQLRQTPLMDSIRKKCFKVDFSLWKEIAIQGFPASLNMMMVSIGVFIITSFVSRYNALAVSAYGVATRIEQMVLLPAMSLNIAALTITGQNFGAKYFNRIREVYHICLKYGLVMMIGGGILVYLAAPFMMELFSEDAAVIAIGVQYLRIEAFVLPAYVFLFLSVSIMQGLKKPHYSLYINIYRLILAPLPVFWFLGDKLEMGVLGIWWGILWITWSAALATVLIVYWLIQRLEKFHLSKSSS